MNGYYNLVCYKYCYDFGSVVFVEDNKFNKLLENFNDFIFDMTSNLLSIILSIFVLLFCSSFNILYSSFKFLFSLIIFC